ncbi:aspartic proteinase 36 isoform X1 [Cryptomeria japonica]|uniref:aspartic proteinase 36 isoform X1 n=1 Tax=Cryptomeria japonica TaxID=3369 RepID=UPI0025AC1B5F|nr:aspartic proteinase 36 isoform X1 [Cryptomeria japonica]
MLGVGLILIGFISSLSLPAVSASAILKLQHIYANKEGRGMSNEQFQMLKAHDRGRHSRMLNSVVAFPLGGSSDPFIAGLYYTKVVLGTPPRAYYVQIDTGSDVLWVNCRPCNACPVTSGLGITLNFFDTQGSSTTSPLPCEDAKCIASNQISDYLCTLPDHYCGYNFAYGDGSSTLGYYVSDLFHFNQIVGDDEPYNTSPSIIFGCSFNQSGDLTKPERAVDGIFGFGQHELSVVSQLHSKGLAPNVFSHCLQGPDRGGGIMVLGEIIEPGIVYTPIVQSQAHYNLNLLGIAVNGQNLPIDPQVFTTTNTRGTIVDCGTTLAYLAEEAYDSFFNTIVAAVSKSTQLVMYKGDPCFFISNSIDEIFPPVTLYFEGAAMELKPQDYLVQQTTSDNTPIWCMGWLKSGAHTNDKKMTILGDLVLKDKIFVYDLENQRIGWTNYDCSSTVNVSTAPDDNKSIHSATLNGSGSPPSKLQKEPATTIYFLILLFCIL